MHYIKVEYEGLKHETERAYLLVIQGEDVWLPKSQVSLEEGKTVAMPEWLARRIEQSNINVDFGLSDYDGFEEDEMLEDAFHASYF